jgi:hypothetical protein
MEEQDQDKRQNHDRFSDFMFGSNKAVHGKDEHSQDSSTNSSSIDYKELLSTVDKLMESVMGLKPLVQPVIEKFLKKK